MANTKDTHGSMVIAYDAIRRLILERELLPGEKINQKAMADTLSVSRTPIVNALHRLESEGLVDRLQNSGFYVHRLSIQELHELFDLREALDIVIVSDLVNNVSDQQIDDLEAIFEPFRGKPADVDVESYRRMDMKFHLTLVEMSTNSVLKKVNDNLQILARSYTAGLIRPHDQTLKEHIGIIAALRNRDRDAAESAMRRHIGMTKELIGETITGLRRMGLDPTGIHLDEISLIEQGGKP